jgi:hypothetical protein
MKEIIKDNFFGLNMFGYVNPHYKKRPIATLSVSRDIISVNLILEIKVFAGAPMWSKACLLNKIKK